MKVIQGCMRKLQGFKFVHNPISGRWNVEGLRWTPTCSNFKIGGSFCPLALTLIYNINIISLE